MIAEIENPKIAFGRIGAMKVKITPKQNALMAISDRVAMSPNYEIEPLAWIAEEAEERAQGEGWDASREYSIGERRSLLALARNIRAAI